MFTHPASDKANETSSPPSDYVVVENNKTERSRHKKMKTEASSSHQPHGQGYSTFRIATSPSSESDAERISTRKIGEKPRGGRQRGSHLPPDKALQVKERRERVACWTCALQRDTVCHFATLAPKKIS